LNIELSNSSERQHGEKLGGCLLVVEGQKTDRENVAMVKRRRILPLLNYIGFHLSSRFYSKTLSTQFVVDSKKPRHFWFKLLCPIYSSKVVVFVCIHLNEIGWLEGRWKELGWIKGMS
jgi:hypothetical protein